MNAMRVVVAALSIALTAAPVSAQDTSKARTKSSVGDALEKAAAARNLKKISQRFDPTFRKYTRRYFGPAFDWRYFKAQGYAESGLKPTATSWVGARGIMQLMPSTYQEIATHRPEFGTIDQPEWNIAAGIMHDRYLWDLWRKDIDDVERHHFMFASYNAGEGTITRALGVARQNGGLAAWSSIELIAPSVQRWRYAETLGYVRRIDSTYARLSSTP